MTRSNLPLISNSTAIWRRLLGNLGLLEILYWTNSVIPMMKNGQSNCIKIRIHPSNTQSLQEYRRVSAKRLLINRQRSQRDRHGVIVCDIINHNGTSEVQTVPLRGF